MWVPVQALCHTSRLRLGHGLNQHMTQTSRSLPLPCHSTWSPWHAAPGLQEMHPLSSVACGAEAGWKSLPFPASQQNCEKPHRIQVACREPVMTEVSGECRNTRSV